MVLSMEEDGCTHTIRSEQVCKKSRGIASSPLTLFGKEPKDNAHEAASNRNKEWLIAIMNRQDDEEAGSECAIQKVPANIREDKTNKKYFEPKAVSLGPYHHGETRDLEEMEKHKIMAARQFVMSKESMKAQGITKATEMFYNKVMGVIESARKYYAAEVVNKLSDEAFASMMFLDGCFVLYVIESELGDIEISTGNIPLIVRDMFLVENQLPFIVLDALMSLRFDSTVEGEKQILEFIDWEILIPMGFNNSDLLDFLRMEELIWSGSHAPLHLLDILWTMLMGFLPSNLEFVEMDHNFGSVTELKEAGIRFGKIQEGFLKDIQLEENYFFPRLLLPPLIINDVTICQLLNLTSFETCSKIHKGCGVSSYICFLDSLINHGADVKELRSKGILHHNLGKDEDVALLFNDWPVKVAQDLKVYRDVKKFISNHRRTKNKVSMARWLDKYFSGPWTTVLSIFGALALFFAFIQTFFTVFPRH